MGEMREMAVVRVSKDVRLLGEKWKMATVRVCKEFTLLGKSGNGYN